MRSITYFNHHNLHHFRYCNSIYPSLHSINVLHYTTSSGNNSTSTITNIKKGQLIIDSENEGVPIVDFLRITFPPLNLGRRAFIAISEKKVRVSRASGTVNQQTQKEQIKQSDNNDNNDGVLIKQKVRPSYRLKKGDIVYYYLPSKLLMCKDKEQKNMAIEKSTRVKVSNRSKKSNDNILTEEQERIIQSWIVYQDSNIVAINKPMGIHTQGGTGVDVSIDDFCSALQFDNEEPPRLVHRLDRDCSGVLLLARSRQVAEHITNLFKAKSIKKAYCALVLGSPDPLSGRITFPLVRDGTKMRMALHQIENSKAAITKYNCMTTVNHPDSNQQISLMHLIPITGRKHQLRVHCSKGLQTPILGDEIYGGYINDSFMIRRDTTQQHLHLFCHFMDIPLGICGSSWTHRRFEITNKKGEKCIRIIAPPPSHIIHTCESLSIPIMKILKQMEAE